MKASWERLRAWAGADWGVLLRCLWLIPAVEFSVRWRAPRHWLPRAAPSSTSARQDAVSTSQAGQVPRWVDAAYRRSPFRPTCLTRSLVLYRILRARGISCQFHLGVRKESGQLQAHAWVECAGLPLSDGNDVAQRFAHFAPSLVAQREKSL